MDHQFVSEHAVATLDLRDLVSHAREGDAAATTELLRRYRPLLARNVRRFAALQNRYQRVFDTDDLWQEATYAFLLLLHRYDPARGVPFSGYMRTLLEWHFRHMQRHVEHQPAADATTSAVAAEADATGDAANSVLVEELFEHLSPRQRQVLEAIYLRGKSSEDTARDLGVTTRAVNATRQRALSVLQQVLTSDENSIGAQARVFPMQVKGSGHET